MKKPDVARPCDGDEVEVKHVSGTYRGTVRETSEDGFLLYSPEERKPNRPVGRYFSWDEVECEEPGTFKSEVKVGGGYGERPKIESTGDTGPARLGSLRNA